MSNKGWVILHDYLEDEDVRIMGPVRFNGSLWSMSVEFRLYDDDGILYYSGVMHEVYKYEDTGEDPLMAYGMPNDGCTRMDILENGEWKQWIA